jgi:diguanylate cyclase (GGDEF)-like protein
MKIPSFFVSPPALATEPLADGLWQCLEATGAAVTLKDTGTGTYLRTSPSAAELLGWSRSDGVGLTDSELVDSGTAMALRAADAHAVSQGGVVRSEHQLPVKGHKQDLQALRHALGTEGHGPARLLCIWSDASELKRKDAQIHTALEQLEAQQNAYRQLRRELEDHRVRDTVTGLYHRAHFEDQVRREVDLSVREQREFAIVSMAVDGIDEFTQAHGSQARDAVLESLGRLLRTNTRMMDAPCRLDNGGFLVLLSGVGLATAHSRMEGLRRQCATHIVVHDGKELHFTLSMGVASFPHTAPVLEQLLEAAQLALNDALDKGGNRVGLAGIRFAPK